MENTSPPGAVKREESRLGRKQWKDMEDRVRRRRVGIDSDEQTHPLIPTRLNSFSAL